MADSWHILPGPGHPYVTHIYIHKFIYIQKVLFVSVFKYIYIYLYVSHELQLNVKLLLLRITLSGTDRLHDPLGLALLARRFEWWVGGLKAVEKAKPSQTPPLKPIENRPYVSIRKLIMNKTVWTSLMTPSHELQLTVKLLLLRITLSGD